MSDSPNAVTRITASALTFMMLAPYAKADTTEALLEKYRSGLKDAKAFRELMDQHVVHENLQNVDEKIVSPFIRSDLTEEGRREAAKALRKKKTYVLAKDRLRVMKAPSIEQLSEGRARISARDKAERLIDEVGSDGKPLIIADSRTGEDAPLLRKPQEMEELKNVRLSPDKQPWSDDYWPIYAGILSSRYADPASPKAKGSENYLDYVNYVTDNRLNPAEINASSTDTLSPAEKYDLLVGDLNYTLTNQNRDAGQQYLAPGNKVETWMGICHGWAQAAYMVPRPRSMITLKAFDGKTDINFYPSDIKALASLLWANGLAPSKVIGARCNLKDPAKDPATGRVLNSGCFDTNPGTWHMVAVNQLGVAKRSFVMDATYDYEVWNQPVVGYKFSWFNPQTGLVGPLAESKISREEFVNDRFRDVKDELGRPLRSAEARSFVGVSMQVKYLVETRPTHSLTDSPSKDRIRSVYYLYDLELDANDEIIGGEWYSNEHPDFLWTPPLKAKVRTQGDFLLRGATWDGKAVVADWVKSLPSGAHAIQSSSALGQPLPTIVETLSVLSAAGISADPTLAKN